MKPRPSFSGPPTHPVSTPSSRSARKSRVEGIISAFAASPLGTVPSLESFVGCVWNDATATPPVGQNGADVWQRCVSAVGSPSPPHRAPGTTEPSGIAQITKPCSVAFPSRTAFTISSRMERTSSHVRRPPPPPP